MDRKLEAEIQKKAFDVFDLHQRDCECSSDVSCEHDYYDVCEYNDEDYNEHDEKFYQILDKCVVYYHSYRNCCDDLEKSFHLDCLLKSFSELILIY